METEKCTLAGAEVEADDCWCLTISPMECRLDNNHRCSHLAEVIHQKATPAQSHACAKMMQTGMCSQITVSRAVGVAMAASWRDAG